MVPFLKSGHILLQCLQLRHKGKDQYVAITTVWLESMWVFLRVVLLTTVEVSTQAVRGG